MYFLTLTLVSCFRVLPESPRWLIQRGRIDIAEKELKRAARLNRVKNLDSIWLRSTLREIGKPVTI